MNDKTFDLTVPLTRQSRTLFLISGVLSTAGGLLWLLGSATGRREEWIFGLLLLVAGILNLLSNSILPRANKYVIAFNNAHLEISRGLFRPRTIPWQMVRKINVQLMSVDLILAGEQARQVTFGEFDYSTHQEVKPKIISAFREFAKAKQIPLTEGYEPSPQTTSLA